jgi:transcription termination factor Rho
MSDKDKSDTDVAAPKRRGRRPKPATLAKPASDAVEEAAPVADDDSSSRKGLTRFKRVAPEPPADEPRPVRADEGPTPETFSTSDEDLREAPPPPAAVAEAPPPVSAPEGGGAPPPASAPAQRNGPGGYGGQNYGGQNYGAPYRGRPWEKPWRKDKFNKDFRKGPPPGPKSYVPHAGNKPPQFNKPPYAGGGGGSRPRGWQSPPVAHEGDAGSLQLGELPMWEALAHNEEIDRMAEAAVSARAEVLNFNRLHSLALRELEDETRAAGLTLPVVPLRRHLLRDWLRHASSGQRPIQITGILELLEDAHGMLAYPSENYRLRALSCFVPQRLIDRYGLQRGHEIEVWAHPPREGESCPFALRVITVNGRPPEDVQQIIPFTELIPYYPTERFLLETSPSAKWDNNSMRIVDLLTPVGLGQRGLIVAAPRTGKTVLMQGMANSIRANRPDVFMIILLVDERPEEVTDFRRSVQGAEVISSTFDEAAESHVHAAEMVIEKARRMIEYGRHVVILLDSITRLARAYNTLMPSSGKILSGGVEANALQKPKRFFGSARNIEGGGSLTILGTALVETGSKMDEVIFEEFKGTGNMELNLDRALSDKRIFPSLSFEKSGTRKEELLYHPDELQKIYSLRRAMKGVPSTEAMEMLIQRVKKTKSNAEFLMSLGR